MFAQSAYLFYQAHRSESAPPVTLQDFLLTKLDGAGQPPAGPRARPSLAAALERHFLSG